MEYRDIKNPKELYSFMKENIKYGFISSKTKEKYLKKEIENDIVYQDILFREYFIQSPKEVLENKCGLCYDQVELERDWFLSHGYPCYTYLTTLYNHTIMIYKEDKYYLFERTFPLCKGIYPFSSLEEVFSYYQSLAQEQVFFYPYKEVSFGSDFYDFVIEKKLEKIKK